MKIKFINHASMLVKVKDYFFLTDPWYLSNAFGGWVQNPHPNYSDVKSLIEIDKNKLFVVISHGHDDHCDDNFIKNYLSEAQSIIPSYKSKGFFRRVNSLFQKKPIEVDYLDSFEIENITINAFIDESGDEDRRNGQSNNDAIMTISSDEEFLIHANDNWYDLPNEVFERLKKLKGKKYTYYFSQNGVADCWPIKYDNYDPITIQNIYEKRCNHYLNSFKKNISKINSDMAFSYANQSSIVGTKKIFNEMNISTPQNIMQKIINNDDDVVQLQPGMLIEDRKLNISDSKDISLFDYCMVKLESKLNHWLKECNVKTNLKFSSDENQRLESDNSVIYYAPKNVWQEIFNGNLNLEAISIGGVGFIKKNPNLNISDVHHLMSKYCYIIQSMVKKNGIINFIRGKAK